MSEQPSAAPPWVAEAPAPMSRRRKLLFALVGFLTVAIVVAIFALDAVLASRAERPLGGDSAGSSGSELPDCADSYPDAFSERARAELTNWYGEDFEAALEPTAVPDGFPADSFAWSGIVPLCGSVIRNSDGEPVVYLFYADDVTRTRFEGVSSMLTATGNIMTEDLVPREPQQIGSDQLSGAEAGDLDELYREFVVPGAGRVWLTLKTDDVLSTSGSGELIIEFGPGS